MIGVSLPFNFLLSENGIYGNTDDYLDTLKNSGVSSIEIRTVKPDADSSQVLLIANKIWRKEMSISIHGCIYSSETAVQDIFSPINEILNNLHQESLTIVIHPINGNNVLMLSMLSDYIRANKFPVKIALENNRLLPDKTFGDSSELVLDAVTKVNRDEIGICFDMGHYYWFSGKNPTKLPSDDFLKRIIHTHIHAINDGNTHFPLTYELPLKEYINSFSHLYFGLYNIELEPKRFSETNIPSEVLIKSVNILNESLPLYSKLYDDMRENYVSRMLNCFDSISKEKPCVSLIQSSSYLFRYGNIKWAMDPAVRIASKFTNALELLPELISQCKFIIITHKHADHFCWRTVTAIKKCPIKWIIPFFMIDKAIEYGIPEENIVTAYPGKELNICSIKILPFNGSHFRPENGKGTDCLGYHISAPDMPSLTFPADVRDFSAIPPADFKTDYIFGHVWLSDDNTNQIEVKKYADLFSDYLLRFSPSKIILAHLYESGRKDSQMWRKEHAELVSEIIKEKSPTTEILIPAAGETILFD